MGFFKDLSAIKAQTKQMEATSSPGARLSEMNAKMAVLNASMAQQAAVLTAAPGDLVEGTAQIVSAAPTTSSIGGTPVVQLSVLLLAPGRPPVPASAAVMVPMTSIHLVQAGATLPAQLSATDPTAFTIDWTSTPS
ncbi:hypothetical protein [Aquihabitans sp. McL0605]|uniref:hypothetical protein n=1 Tax=Aquihabitans sp. McL0605 TaxID=3415671 RepID=UPI003CEAE6AC